MQRQEKKLVKFKTLQSTMFKDWKTSAIEKGKGRVEKGNILFNKL